MPEITAYLCCKKLSGISIQKASDLNGISVSDTEITVSMVPVSSCDVMMDQITVSLEPSPIVGGKSVYYCQGTSDFLSIEYPSYSGDVLIREYPELKVKNGSHCHWFSTQTLGNGPSRCVGYGCLFAETAAGPGGEIPNSKNDVFPDLNAENTHQLTDNQISPGMLVSVRHYFYNGTDTISDVADSEYYTSPALTGGEITAIHGSYGDVDISYDVSIEGSTVVCKPSDFVNWEIGDWVIVLKDEHRIVPMRIGSDGA